MNNEHDVNNIISEMLGETSNLSDGYHTFGELYEHRAVLYIALCKSKQDFRYHGDSRNIFGDSKVCIRSKIHEDGLNVWQDWGMFLLVLHTDKGQISYHLDNKYWDDCDFAETQIKAKTKFDGHTSEDVLLRLLSI